MSSPLPLDPYEVLGVARDANLTAIRSAHRKLALKHHPDRIKDEAERKKGSEEFQKAQQAYELLADEKRRARYDDQVRLAALRKEAMMNERTMPVRSASFPVPQQQPQNPAYRPQPPQQPAYEYRDGRMYEERKPRYSEEDDRYAEPTPPPRPSARKAASAYERRPTSSYNDEKKKHSEKASGLASYFESKLKEKARLARERVAHSESAKQRDKDRRKDTDSKYSSRSAYVEDDSTSDSDTITYVSRNPQPRKQESRKSEPHRHATYEVPPTRKSRESDRKRETRDTRASSSYSSDSSSSDDDDEDLWARKHREATAYISERSVPGRPGILRTDSAHYIAPKDRTSGKKSGSDRDERREERTRSSRSHRPPPIEVVEPPKRNPQSRKAPSMANATSSPAALKGMTGQRDAPQPHRSSTGDYPSDRKRPMPGMNRSNTMPVPPVSTRKESSRGSKLKQSETFDSGYGSSSSPATPDHRGTSPPKSSSKKYFIVEEDPELSRGSYRTVPLSEDEYPSRRTRSPSPPPRERESHRDRERKRDRPERPSIQTNPSYAKGARSTSYAASPDQMSPRHNTFRTDSSRSGMRGEAPPLSRGDSSRHLYGEINQKDDGYRFSPDNVRYTPKPSDVRYTHARRSSEDKKKDSFTNSNHYENLHSSRTGRRESVF